jgi:phytoene dehydrogenase-like protein
MTAPHDVIIIGAGLAGLAAARTCAAAGLTPLVLEAASEVGGRVATDRVDGFLLDRGFQVLLDSYPEAQRHLDLPALQLARFAPGALVWRGRGFGRVADPWRAPLAGARSLLSGVFTARDAWRMLRLRSDAILGLEGEALDHGEVSAVRALRGRGFSERAIERFFRPFFGGVFLDAQLGAPAHWLEFLFGMFATGHATLPAAGMQAIPRQLAAGLPVGSVRTAARVRSIRGGQVELDSGEELRARTIIVATDARHAAVLVPGSRSSTWNGCTTLHYAASSSPVAGPLLVLDGEGRRGPVNSVCVPSEVSPTYAPPGQSLVSATVVGHAGPDDGALDRDARAQLSRWFGADAVRDWRLLRVTRVPYALPRSVPHPAHAAAGVRLGEGIYACGDYFETPSINGALRSGRRAAEAVLADLGVRRVSAA